MIFENLAGIQKYVYLSAPVFTRDFVCMLFKPNRSIFDK